MGLNRNSHLNTESYLAPLGTGRFEHPLAVSGRTQARANACMCGKASAGAHIRRNYVQQVLQGATLRLTTAAVRTAVPKIRLWPDSRESDPQAAGPQTSVFSARALAPYAHAENTLETEAESGSCESLTVSHPLTHCSEAATSAAPLLRSSSAPVLV